MFRVSGLKWDHIVALNSRWTRRQFPNRRHGGPYGEGRGGAFLNYLAGQGHSATPRVPHPNLGLMDNLSIIHELSGA